MLRELLVESYINSEIFTGIWCNINYCNRARTTPIIEISTPHNFQLSKQQNRTRTTSSTVLGTPPNRTRTMNFPLEELWGGCFVSWGLSPRGTVPETVLGHLLTFAHHSKNPFLGWRDMGRRIPNPTRRAWRGIWMSQGEKCRETIFAAQLPRPLPSLRGEFWKRGKIPALSYPVSPYPPNLGGAISPPKFWGWSVRNALFYSVFWGPPPKFWREGPTWASEFWPQCPIRPVRRQKMAKTKFRWSGFFGGGGFSRNHPNPPSNRVFLVESVAQFLVL